MKQNTKNTATPHTNTPSKLRVQPNKNTILHPKKLQLHEMLPMDTCVKFQITMIVVATNTLRA